MSAIDLAVHACKAALAQSGVKPAELDHVLLGNVMQTSPDAIYGARHVGLKAGVPIEVPALTMMITPSRWTLTEAGGRSGCRQSHEFGYCAAEHSYGKASRDMQVHYMVCASAPLPPCALEGASKATGHARTIHALGPMCGVDAPGRDQSAVRHGLQSTACPFGRSFVEDGVTLHHRPLFNVGGRGHPDCCAYDRCDSDRGLCAPARGPPVVHR